MDRVEHDLTGEQWASLQEAWAGCAYCGATDRALQRDCVLALSRGGRYTLTNIVPACRSCNTSKCNDEVTGWLRRKRLDERAFLLRHLEITTALSTLSSLVQEHTPDELRGRVLSIFGLAFRGGLPLGSLVGGLVVRAAGAPIVMAVASGLLLVLAVFLLLRHRDLRAL